MINTAISESTDAISFIPAWFAKKFGDSFNIKVLKADFDIPDSQCYMTYNKSSLKNEGFPELLELINGCKKDIEQLYVICFFTHRFNKAFQAASQHGLHR